MRCSLVISACVAIASTVVTGVVQSSEAKYYPQASRQSLQIGAEEFREGYLTLRGLEGLHVDLSVVMAAGKDKGVVVPESLELRARDKVESAGLYWLSKEEMQVTPGQPMMNLWPAYKGGAVAVEGSVLDDNTVTNTHACEIPVSCKNSLWAGFGQSASLLRQPENQYRLSTWGDGDESNQCDDRGEWMAEAVLGKLDLFIVDFKKAQLEMTPVLVEKTADVPEHCSQSWVTHLNVFATDESKINDAVKPIFDRLNEVAERCNTFNYIIETHADQRADSEYNDLLTEARARSIKDYLLSKGMPYKRIKMRPLGESEPITQGSTEADHAKNRRVIIKPVDLEAFTNAELDY